MPDNPPELSAPPSSTSTRLCEIVTVVIRILAIKLGLDSLQLLLSIFAGYQSGSYHRYQLIVFAVWAVCAYWLWQLSPFFARRITRGQDSLLDCGNLTLIDLYTFAFLLVGLYFALDSFGPSLTWLHYSIVQSSSDAPLSPEQRGNFYTFFKYLVKLLLGLALIFIGRKFAAKLINNQNK